MIRAEIITVESDESGFFLSVFTDQGERLDIDMHHLVLDFYASVQKEIRPYVLEAESARYERPTLYVEEGSGYTLDDPKSPTYHERMVGDA